MTTVQVSEVDRLRTAIEDIDHQIRLLLVRRRHVSHSIRRAKLGTGLPDTDLTREKQILSDYRHWLGNQHGGALGHAVLDFSKDHTS